MLNPKVSICVPVYGVERYISKCAESLFLQTYDNIEYIFVDDCSTDKSIKILKQISNKFPRRISQIKIIQHSQNKGLACARNTAVANATGDFLTHVDSDDWIELNMVELMVKSQIENDADIVCVGCSHDINGKCKRLDIPPMVEERQQLLFQLLTRSQNLAVWGRLYRTSLYRDNNIRTVEGLNMAEDYQVTPILAYFSRKISTIRLPLYHYNVGNETSYINSNKKQYESQLMASCNVVFDFFRNKGDKYKTAIEKAQYKIYSGLVLGAASVNDYATYKKYKLLLNNINVDIKKQTTIRNGWLLNIHSFKILRAILFLVKIAKKSINRLRY